MSRGPGLFSDFGKKARDSLTKDCLVDRKITISTFTGSGVALTSNLVMKGGLSSGDVAAQYKHKNAVLDVKLDTDSNIITTLVVTDLLPCTKAIASLKLPDYNSGKLEVQYFHKHASFTTAVGLNKCPALDLSATIGTPSIACGAEATYLTTSGEFAKYNAGVSLTKPDSSASLIRFPCLPSVLGSPRHHAYGYLKPHAEAKATHGYVQSRRL